MSDLPTTCPQCGSTEVHFRKSCGDWACDHCEHKWIPAAPADSSPSPPVPKHGYSSATAAAMARSWPAASIRTSPVQLRGLARHAENPLGHGLSARDRGRPP
jgi:hypothetical protein